MSILGEGIGGLRGKGRGARDLLLLSAIAIATVSVLTPVESREVLVVSVDSCYDADTCRVTIPDWPPLVGHRLPVRLKGLDSPEIRGECLRESEMAIEARDYLRKLIARADSVELHSPERGKYFRLLARMVLVFDHQQVDVATVLIEKGWARPYDGGTRASWC